MIRILPSDSFTISTHLKANEIKCEIGKATKKSIASQINIFRRDNEPEFSGEFIKNIFAIKRISGIKNSFRPVMKGKVEETSVGSKVSINITIDEFLGSLWLVWMALATFGAFIAGVYSIIKWTFNEFIFIALVFPIFGYVLMQTGYRSEARKAKGFILAILNGKIEPGNM